jgi:hypothetical protein
MLTFASSTAAGTSIVNYIVDNALRDFVLVGHSYGGTIIGVRAALVSSRFTSFFC